MEQRRECDNTGKDTEVGRMSGEIDAGIRCPGCGGEMEPGYIAGHWIRLRWCAEPNTKTIFAGEPLKKKRDLWNAPTLEAKRCPRCKLGVFTYDN